MKKTYGKIRFVKDKGSDWLCQNRETNRVLGLVSFHNGVNSWTFYSYSSYFFENTELRDIADFMDQLEKP